MYFFLGALRVNSFFIVNVANKKSPMPSLLFIYDKYLYWARLKPTVTVIGGMNGFKD